MGELSPILRTIEGGLIGFHCPGCECGHAVRVRDASGQRPSWEWNGDPDKPTFNPSILVTYNGSDAGRDGAPPAVCHSFVRDGQIQFLGDCTHKLAGQTVPIPTWAEAEE